MDNNVINVPITFEISNLFLVFLIIILGLLFGQLKIKGIGLGSSGVLIAAIVFGYYYDVRQVAELQMLGITLFLWAVGLEAGPKFFRAFQRMGKLYVSMVIFLLSVAGLTTIAAINLFNIPSSLGLGLFAGSMTSTPALVSATQVADKNMVIIGYGLAYPIGLLGVILFINITLRILKKKLLEQDGIESQIHMRVYRLANPDLHRKLISELKFFKENEVIITGVKRENNMFLVSPKTTLMKGDLIRLEGSLENIQKVGEIIGKRVEADLDTKSELDIRSINVENIKNVNKTLRDLAIRIKFNVTVTKVNRSGFEMFPKPDLIIEYGDIIEVIGNSHKLDELELFLGHKHHTVHPRVDILSFALMLFLSFLIGGINISLEGLGDFSIGIAGAGLIIGLIFGHYGKIGNFIGRFPLQSTKVLKEFGISLFFVQVGIKAGQVIGNNGLDSNTLYYVLFAFIVMIIPMMLSLIFGFVFLKLSLSECYGVICGGMTCTPGLQIIREVDNSEKPVMSYSTVYPIALVIVIILVQIINLLN